MGKIYGSMDVQNRTDRTEEIVAEGKAHREKYPSFISNKPIEYEDH